MPIDPALDEIGWYCGNSPYSNPIGLKDVGLKAPNAWGLYDMHGNACEGVWDNYLAGYETLPEVDPVHDPGGSGDRILKGGNYDDPAAHCRSAVRVARSPQYQSSWFGFRPIRTAR